MKSLNQFKISNKKYKKHAIFNGRILILGYGSVGQAILPVLLKHIGVEPNKITVLEKDNNKKKFDSRHASSGIKYVPKKYYLIITKPN